jgi:hypothetical protein
MRAFPRRLIALFVLLSFGPLAFGGQGWHLLTEHYACGVHGSAVDGSVRSSVGHAHSCGHAHADCHDGNDCPADRRPVADAERPNIELPHHDHNLCAVCQFFAQPQQLATSTFFQVVEFACIAAPLMNSGAPHTTSLLPYRSRAPPAGAHSA